MAFLICFLTMTGIIAVTYNSLRHLSRSMHWFEAAQEINSNIEEMRRHEKNFF